MFLAKIWFLQFDHNKLKLIVNSKKITFLFWITIRIKGKKGIFEPTIFELDQPFVKVVAEFMAHPVL